MSPLSTHRDEPKCRENLEDQIFRCPSVFGRLWAVAGFREGNRDVYVHPLDRTYAPVAVDGALRQMHGELFRKWLSFPLERQERDLLVWCNGVAQSDDEIRSLLKDVERQHRRMIPRQHEQAEADLFLADLEVVFLVLKTTEQQQSSSAKAPSTLPGLLRSLMRSFQERSTSGS